MEKYPSPPMLPDSVRRLDNHLHALKCGAVYRDNKNRAFYAVPTSTRSNGRMIIPDKTITKFLKDGKVTQQDIDAIQKRF